MLFHSESYTFSISADGIFVLQNDRCLYKNERPVQLIVKKATTQAMPYAFAYDSTDDEAKEAYAVVSTHCGAVFRICDRFSLQADGLHVTRTAAVLAEGTGDLGFESRISLSPVFAEAPSEMLCFSPGYWYRQNEFGPGHAMGKNLHNSYYWFLESRAALPLFSMYHPETKLAICFSREAADVGMRSIGVEFSESSIDPLMDLGALGMSKEGSHTINYTYYGYGIKGTPVCKPAPLSIDYVYPGCDGELPMSNHYRGLDFEEPQQSFQRTYHPIKTDFTHSFSIVIHVSEEPDFQTMMTHSWRMVYDRMRSPLFSVDIEQNFHDNMAILNHFTKQYGDSIGLPFACQLPNMDINSVSFQFGFVGQQPGIGFLLLRYGYDHDRKDCYEKGCAMIDFWTSAANTPEALPPSCYNPINGTFEPYPYYTRMMADGLEAILNAYRFLSEKGTEKPEWLSFLVRMADSLCSLQNSDGSFSRAYNKDHSIRMDSKSNTPSLIRFFTEMYLLTGTQAYKECALSAGSFSFEHLYKNVEYRGGTCDNMDIQDKEAGIYAIWGFLALYDLTGEAQWLTAACGAADYTETWTYAWEYPIYVPWPKHPFHRYSISGQSIITLAGGADVYMAACSYTYYRLYLLTKDRHYLNFAEFIEKNTRQSTDVDGSDYCMRGLGHESGGFATQIMGSHYHWLPWCTFVEAEPITRMYQTFGVYSIEEAQKLPEEELQKRNRIYPIR